MLSCGSGAGGGASCTLACSVNPAPYLAEMSGGRGERMKETGGEGSEGRGQEAGDEKRRERTGGRREGEGRGQKEGGE